MQVSAVAFVGYPVSIVFHALVVAVCFMPN